jgi:hypothetical protein
MKRLIVILILMFLLYAGCEKEKDYVSVNVNNITPNGDIYYTVTNNSTFTLKCKVIFKLDAENIKKFESDCFIVEGFKTLPRIEKTDNIIYYAEPTVILCK